MQESLSPEHGCELLTNSLEQLLNCCAVPNKCCRHLKPSRWNVTNSSLDIVRNPLHEIAAVLILHVQHLFIYFFHWHATPEHSRDCEVSSVPRVTSGHHVLSVKHLLGQLRNSQSTVLLRSSWRQRCESGHEEMEPREWNHVDSKLPQISIQLTGESKTSRDSRHCCRDQVVEISVGRSCQFERSETDVVQCLIVNAIRLVGVFYKLVDRQCCIVWFYDSVGYLWRRYNGECVHDSIGVLFSDFGN